MLFRVMQSCTNKVIFTYKEQVSQDLKDGFPTCLLLTRYLYLEITYIIQGYSTEDLRPKGAVTPPPYSPPPSSGALCRLSLFQPLPGLTEVGTREGKEKPAFPQLGHETPPANHIEPALPAIQSQQAWCSYAVNALS
jgi:hypothetical protein